MREWRMSQSLTAYLKTWIVPLIVGLILLGASVFYIQLATGVITPSALNQGLAITSLVLLSFVLLLGPFSRVYDRFDVLLHHRKNLGFSAFATALVHVYLTLFPLARSGPLGFIKARPLSAYPGLAAIALFLFLFVISIEKVKVKLHIDRWWKLQYWGARLAFIAILVHFVVLKQAGWVRWFFTPTGLPPAGLLASLVAVFVVLVRVSDLVGKRFARMTIPVWFVALAAAKMWLFLR